MLGKWGETKYKSKIDFESYKDYLEYMYGKTEGFIARCCDFSDKNPQKLYKRDKLISENTYNNLPDIYTSMNTFMTGKSREINNIKRFNALYIDIDCYKLELTPEQVNFELEREYFGKIIPCPTFRIKSGRGLYLIWKIYKGDDRKALPAWNKIQQYLCDKLSVFGADRTAIDAARVLRVPGTINSTAGKKVEIMDFDDVQYTLYEIAKEHNIDIGKSKFFVNGHRWGEATERQIECATEISNEQNLSLPNFKNFDETFEFIGRYAERRFRSDKSATDKQKNYAAKIAREKKLELPDFSDFNATGDFIAKHSNKKPYEIKSFLDYWRRDIEMLITVLRKGEDCRRELCLFLNRLWVCETTRDYDMALKSTLELNKKLDKPFTDSYVRSHTKSAEDIIKRGNTYRYTKKNILELLDITEDEMKNLRYLNNLTKKERESIRKRKSYEKRLDEAGKNTKKEEIRLRREKIAEMLKESKKEKEICRELKISRQTYYNDRIVIITQGLVKRAAKTIMEVKRTANKITSSIKDIIKETFENIKELSAKANSSNDILNQIKKVKIKW